MKRNKFHYLILEKHKSKIWGRVSINDNLLFDSANNLSVLEKKSKIAINDFEGFENIEFEYGYDMTMFFEEYNFLNQSKVAELAGINPALIRQYSSGIEQPSLAQVKKIETAVKKSG